MSTTDVHALSFEPLVHTGSLHRGLQWSPRKVWRFGADIQNHSCDKGSGGSWDPVMAFLWVGAGRWRACRHTRGRLCAHSINTGICLCKLIFNPLSTWCWVHWRWHSEKQHWTTLKSMYKFTSIHRRIVQQEATTSDVVLCLQVLITGTKDSGPSIRSLQQNPSRWH